MARTFLMVVLALMLTAGVFVTADQVDAGTRTADLKADVGSGCCGMTDAAGSEVHGGMEASACPEMDASACPEMGASGCPGMSPDHCEGEAMKAHGECPYSGAKAHASGKASAATI